MTRRLATDYPEDSYQEPRSAAAIPLPHLGVSPVLLCDKTHIMAGFPEESAGEGQGLCGAATAVFSHVDPEPVPKGALIWGALQAAFRQREKPGVEGG